MATTLIAQYQAATSDQTFIQRVEMAMLQTCNNLSSEAASVINHTNRMALMKAATNAPETWAPQFAKLVASNGIDSASTDAQIQGQISSSWNAMAGMD
jgi:hypothetical protein